MQAAPRGVNHAVPHVVKHRGVHQWRETPALWGSKSTPAETGQGALRCECLVSVHNDWVIVGVVFGGGLALDV